MSSQATQIPVRNLQLDFFRGVALLIIFINHVPGNELLLYTPSRFGLSDAAEIFVFLSGYAAALAYGKSFESRGLGLGSVSVLYRCAQIYAAHLGIFFLLAVICVLGNAAFGTPDYIDRLNIRFFFDHTEEALLGLISLRYVPNYFDILPMYLVVMLWIPVVWALSRIKVWLALAVPVALYLAMWGFGLEFRAELHGDRPWFFNPFGWQLIFFAGFAFGRGWLKPPAPKPWRLVLCGVFILASLPFSPEPALRPTEWLMRLHAEMHPWLDKTQFGLLRGVHFLALAYVVRSLLKEREHWLAGRVARPILRMGSQSLPVFAVAMALSYIGGMVFDRLGHGWLGLSVVNIGGGAGLMLSASLMAWLKSRPWRMPNAAAPKVHAPGTGPGIPLGAPHSIPLVAWTGNPTALKFAGNGLGSPSNSAIPNSQRTDGILRSLSRVGAAPRMAPNRRAGHRERGFG